MVALRFDARTIRVRPSGGGGYKTHLQAQESVHTLSRESPFIAIEGVDGAIRARPSDVTVIGIDIPRVNSGSRRTGPRASNCGAEAGRRPSTCRIPL